jgi:hypothetical protein
MEMAIITMTITVTVTVAVCGSQRVSVAVVAVAIVANKMMEMQKCKQQKTEPEYLKCTKTSSSGVQQDHWVGVKYILTLIKIV